MAILFLIVFIDLVGFGLVIPLLPFYAERYAASPEQVTLMMAAYSMAQLVTAPLLGWVSDRIGRRPVLALSLLGSCAAYLWLGFADALWMLFGARILAGACAGNIAAAQAYIADSTTPENRAKGMGLIGAAFGFGFIIGPALGGLLAGNDPSSEAIARPAFVAAGLSALAFLGVLVFLEETLTADRRGVASRTGRLAALGAALARPELRSIVLLYFALVFAFSGMETTFAMWASRQFGWGPAPVGYVFCFVGVMSALMQGVLIGRLTRRWGEETILRAGLASIALGLLALPMAQGVPLLLVASALLALGMGMAQPSLNSLVSRRAGPREQGVVLGVTQSVGSLARIVGPAMAGVLFAQFGRHAPYYAGAAIVAAAFIAALRLRAWNEPALAGQKP